MSYFFWFLFFLCIPIVVHLFSFRRAKKLFFTNVKFIKLVSTETKSKTRLKQLLVLVSRILAFSFLIFAFVSSFIQMGNDGALADDSLGLIYLDNSSSAVGADLGNGTAVIESLLVGSQFKKGRFLTNDFNPFSNRDRTQGEILDELKRVKTSYVSRRLSEVIGRDDESRTAYLISDFEDISHGDLVQIREDSTREYYLLVKDISKVRNVYVDSVWIERDLDNYENSILKCILGHSENESDANVVVKLLDGMGNQVSSVVKGLQDDPLITFTIPSRDATSAYRIQLSGDDVEYDNNFYFVLGRRPKPRILLLSVTENSYLNSVFGNDELFELTVAEPDEMDYEQLQDVDLIVLNDFDQFPKGLIKQAVEKSSIFIFPSDSIDRDNYGGEAMLSLKYRQNTETQQLQLEEGNILMVGAYTSANDDVFLPSAIGKYSIQSTHERLMTLRDGSTFLGKTVGSPLYFLLSPLKDEYTGLPKHSIFLPFMYRVAEQSVGNGSSLFSYPGNYLAIDKFSADVPPKVISDDLELIPEFVLQNQKGLVRVPNSLAPGFYHILQEDDTVKSFGLNTSKNESIFDGPSFEEITEFFSDSEHVNVISVFDDYQNSPLPKQGNNDLWKYALILALTFLLVETVFHRYLK